MTPAHDPRGPLTVLSAPSEGASTVDHPAADGPGLFEIANPDHGAGHPACHHRAAARRQPGAHPARC